MAQTARKFLWQTDPAPAVAPPVEAGMASAPAPSPARALQDQLAMAFAAEMPEPHVQPWPPATRLLVLGGLTVGSWVALLTGARALLRLAHG